jgi:hypothetical protein
MASDGKSCNIPTSQTSRNIGSLKLVNNSKNLEKGSQPPAGYRDSQNNNPSTIDFTTSGTSAWNAGGKTGICNQKNWLNTNNIFWDGVTNFNGC